MLQGEKLEIYSFPLNKFCSCLNVYNFDKEKAEYGNL